MGAATELPDGTLDYGDKTYDPATKKFTPKAQAGAAGGGMPNFDNSAQNDPGYGEVLDEMWKRFRTDGGAGQAIDLAGGKIREAGIGAGKELGASLASRGVSGTGAETLARGKLAGQVQGSIAGAAADIANQREREKDAALNSIGGVIGNRSASNLANRQLGLQQWEGVRADQRATEAAQSAQQLAILQLLAQAGQTPFETPVASGGGYPAGGSGGGFMGASGAYGG